MTLPSESLRVPPGSGVDALVTHGVYQIATGKWRAGERLPSVRAAAASWDVDPRKVLRAFRRLEELRLVEARERSGFYVLPGPAVGRVARHRHELERLFERFAATVDAETQLSPLGVFHYFAHLAAIRARDEPPCAFVECTRTQAVGHASEVTERLGVPCEALTLSDLEPGLQRLPDRLRTFLVSSFHIGEVGEAIERAGRVACSVPVEVSEDLATRLPAAAREGVVFESDETEARNILADVEQIEVPLELRFEVTQDLDAALRSTLGARRGGASVALLSPRLWGHASPDWQADPRVLQIAFRVRRDAWAGIGDALGLPLGSLVDADGS